ncbi:ABC transporter permease [Nocardioides mangrovi]|uniref:ABC transporter permease n=1 Tax=Nocardioides mangrovi TaxID=2874580 RepID=A0ABS7UEX6_9ACTN|nr:ABC transporter permease [Nocardioides mangrovi]MBZ5739370.1 ABC transporter permease [Nocardioides mangrovi]
MPSSPDATTVPAPTAAAPARRRMLPLPSRPGRRGHEARPVGAVVALTLLGVVVLVALLGPALSPYSSITVSGPPDLAPFSAGHWLGTDHLGFDIATRVVEGARTSLYAACVVTLGSAVFGLALGTLAGMAGGWVDQVLMRLTDLFLAFPATIVAMAVAMGLGPSLSSSMIGIAVIWWPLYARLTRGEVRRVASSPHVEAARLSGTRGLTLVRRHVVPSVLPTVVVTASMDIGGVIAMLAGLAFIGLGSPEPAPELGLMASSGMQYILGSWWIAVIPGIAVGLLSLLFTYTGDALRSLLRGTGA